MSDRVRPTKLKFKGESHKKKRKRHDDDDGHASSSRRKDDETEADEKWVFPENPNEIRGPTFIIHPSEPSPICITFDATRGRIILAPLDKHKDDADGEDGPSPQEQPVLDRIPTDVSQVWVITRVAGSPTINLRTGTGEGKFLTCDEHGLVSAFREARGPQEEFTPVILPDGMVAFQNIYEKYLSLDEAAGGTLQLRGDTEEIGFNERFHVKIQGKYKREANEEERKKEGIIAKPKIDEVATNQVYQAWGAGRSIVSKEDKSELKKARKEGRLSEALLDRRAKLKSDRFC